MSEATIINKPGLNVHAVSLTEHVTEYFHAKHQYSLSKNLRENKIKIRNCEYFP